MKWLRPEEVANDPRIQHLGNADWVRKQLRTGKLRGSRVSGRWSVPIATEPGEVDAIDEMFENASNQPRRKRGRVA